MNDSQKSIPSKTVILIADDTESNRRLLQAVLEGAGYKTLMAEDGERALAILKSKHVDAVVSDILMPNVDGFRLCTEVKSSPKTKHIPVLLQSSAYLSSEDEGFAESIGADAFLRRPYDLDTLLKAVQKMLSNTAAEPIESDAEAIEKRHTERMAATLARTQSDLVQISKDAKEGSDRFRSLTDHLPVAYIYCDADSVIREWNPAAEKIFGFSAEAAVGQSLDQFLFSEGAAELSGGTDTPIEHTRQNGEKVACEWSHTVLTTTKGQIKGMISVAKDVTERVASDARTQGYVEQLRALSARMVDTQEQERRHIAGELHDEVGQMLLGLQLSLELSKRTPGKVHEAESILTELIRKVRDMSLDLRPPMLDDLGLLPALSWLCERSGRVGIPVEFQHRDLKGINAGVRTRTAAFRIVQEAISNAAKHASASKVKVNVWASKETVHAQVQDDGIGFDVLRALKKVNSSGLAGMLERATAASGTFCVESAPGEGTLVMATLPLAN